MTKITNKKFGYTLAAVSLGLLVFASTMAIGWVTSAANAQQVIPEDTAIIEHIPPAPVLSSAEQQALAEIVKNVPEVKAWAADGWQYLTVDFLGTVEPPKWTHANVHLKLPPSAVAQKYCSEGWEAMAKINLETMQVEHAAFPSAANDQCGGIQFSGRVEITDTTSTASAADSIIPQAFAVITTNGREIARQNDVNDLFANHYGNKVIMRTPTISSTIYTKMDQWITHLLNTDLGPGKFLQIGWMATAITFPGGTDIFANNKYVVYVDEAAYGNNYPHWTGLAWSNGSNMNLQQLGCQPNNFYAQIIIYTGITWTHPTNIPCSTATTDDWNNNSVWFENGNTMPSSGWAPYITSAVSAVSAYQKKDSPTNPNIQWSASTNQKYTCAGYAASGVITQTLANLGPAIWSSLQNMPTRTTC